MAEQLKPCPFCGGNAELDTGQSYRTFRTGDLDTRVAVYCTSCSADMGECRADHRGTDIDDLIHEVTSRWNARSGSNEQMIAELCEAAINYHKAFPRLSNGPQEDALKRAAHAFAQARGAGREDTEGSASGFGIDHRPWGAR